MKTQSYQFRRMQTGKIEISYIRNSIGTFLYVTEAQIRREALTGDPRYVAALAWLEKQKQTVTA